MSLPHLSFGLGITKGFATFELEGDSHVNHNKCDACADCRVQDDEQVLLTDCCHDEDLSIAMIVPQRLIDLWVDQQDNFSARTGRSTDKRCAAGGLSLEEQEATIRILVTETLPPDGKRKTPERPG